jgi:hypothetical protein
VIPLIIFRPEAILGQKLVGNSAVGYTVGCCVTTVYQLLWLLSSEYGCVVICGKTEIQSVRQSGEGNQEDAKAAFSDSDGASNGTTRKSVGCVTGVTALSIVAIPVSLAV